MSALPSPPLTVTRSAAFVNLDAVAANVRALVRAIGPGVGLMAVVKANGYGHGAVPVAITALRAGAVALAVACVDEGVQLRRAGLTAPILLLGPTAPEQMGTVVAQRLTPTICDRPAAEALRAAVAAAGRPAHAIHVKIDSGLNRYGIDAGAALPFIEWLYEQPEFKVEALFTHFSCAEEEDGSSTDAEYGRFAAVVEALRRGGRRPRLHAANSAATMRYPHLRLDIVRPGLALYGLAGGYPGAGRLTQWPALEIRGRVGRVQTLSPGEGVGYGQTYVTEEPRRLALIGIGYGDGLPRLLGNRGAILINGHRAPIRGRLSMDQTVVDVTGLGPVEVGDIAIIVGRQGEEAIGADEIGAWAETISYEVVVGLTGRLPRYYLLHGRLVGVTDLLGSRLLSAAPEEDIFHWRGPARAAEAASGS